MKQGIKIATLCLFLKIHLNKIVPKSRCDNRESPWLAASLRNRGLQNKTSSTT